MRSNKYNCFVVTLAGSLEELQNNVNNLLHEIEYEYELEDIQYQVYQEANPIAGTVKIQFGAILIIRTSYS